MNHQPTFRTAVKQQRFVGPKSQDLWISFRIDPTVGAKYSRILPNLFGSCIATVGLWTRPCEMIGSRGERGVFPVKNAWLNDCFCMCDKRSDSYVDFFMKKFEKKRRAQAFSNENQRKISIRIWAYMLQMRDTHFWLGSTRLPYEQSKKLHLFVVKSRGDLFSLGNKKELFSTIAMARAYTKAYRFGVYQVSDTEINRIQEKLHLQLPSLARIKARFRNKSLRKQRRIKFCRTWCPIEKRLMAYGPQSNPYPYGTAKPSFRILNGGKRLPVRRHFPRGHSFAASLTLTLRQTSRFMAINCPRLDTRRALNLVANSVGTTMSKPRTS